MKHLHLRRIIENCHIQNKTCVLFLAILFATIIYLYPFSHYRFATNDDFFCYLLSHLDFSERLNYHDAAAKAQGRIHFYIAFFAQEIAYIFDNVYTLRFICNAFKVTNFFLFSYIIYLHTRNINYAVFAYITTIIFLQDDSGFNAVSGYTFSYQLYLSIFLIVFILVYRLLKKHSRVIYVLALILCALFLTMSEASMPMVMFLLVPYAIFTSYDLLNKHLLLYISPFFVLPLLVASAWLYFKNYVATSVYAGVVPSFDFSQCIQTLFHFSFSHFSCRSFLYDNHLILSGLGPGLRIGSSVAFMGISLEPAFFPYYIVTSLAITFLLGKCMLNMDIRATKKDLLAILVFGFLVVLIPNILTAFSSRYQGLRGQGFPSTPYSYYSIFGFAIIFIAIVMYANTRLAKRARAIVLSILCLVFFATSVTSLATNYSFGSLRYADSIKWNLVDFFIRTRSFKQITEGSVLYTQNLYDQKFVKRTVSKQTVVKRTKPKPPQQFWARYISLKSGLKDIRILPISAGNNNKDIRYFFDLKQYLHDTTDTSFFVFSQNAHCVYPNHENSFVYSDNASIGVYSRASLLSITYRSKDGLYKSLEARMPDQTHFSEIEIRDDDQIVLNSFIVMPIL